MIWEIWMEKESDHRWMIWTWFDLLNSFRFNKHHIGINLLLIIFKRNNTKNSKPFHGSLVWTLQSRTLLATTSSSLYPPLVYYNLGVFKMVIDKVLELFREAYGLGLSALRHFPRCQCFYAWRLEYKSPEDFGKFTSFQRKNINLYQPY